MNKLYYNSPVFLQNIYTSLYGYRLKSKRYNKIYRNSLEKLRKNEIKPNKQLENLLNHLNTNIEFYRGSCKINSDPLKVLLSLPLTEKEDLRTELELRSYKAKGIRIGKTGGDYR